MDMTDKSKPFFTMFPKIKPFTNKERDILLKDIKFTQPAENCRHDLQPDLCPYTTCKNSGKFSKLQYEIPGIYSAS